MHKWSWKLQTLTKQQLRKTLLTLRDTILPVQCDSAACSAVQIFLDHPLFAQSQNIACYAAKGNEFDCTPFIKAIWTAKKNCFLPVLLNNQSLHFVSYQADDSLHLNRYQILEPRHGRIISCAELDVVFLPMVGFDLQGGRLGMGGGYYDRTFSFLNREKIKKPYLVGLAYECQYTPHISIENHDVLVNAVLTEKQMYTFHSRN